MTDPRRLARSLVVTVLLFVTIVAAAQPAVAGGRARRFRNEMLRLVNETRRAHGLGGVALNGRLSPEAWRHSQTMGRHFDLFHTTDVWALVQPFGAHTWGENIAYAETLRRVEQLWMQSYEHRVNLLNPAFSHAAIGVVKIRGWLWVTLQLYG